MKNFYEFSQMLEYSASEPQSPAATPGIQAIPAGAGEAEQMQQQQQQQQPGQADQEANAQLRIAMQKFEQYVLPSLDNIRSPESKQQFLQFVTQHAGFSNQSQLKQATNQLGTAARSGEISAGQQSQPNT